MRSGQLAMRRSPADRASSDSVSVGYVATGVAPHGLTTRISYTVPSNKRAQLGLLDILAQRDTAAAPLGVVDVQYQVRPLGGAAIRIFHERLQTNGVGDTRSKGAGCSLEMQASDILEAQTADASTGGTVTYRVCMYAIEYNN